MNWIMTWQVALISFVVFVRSPRVDAKPTDAFVELTKKPYYVDKTNLLHVISEFHHNYDFVACPSRFLKSSNLQMIKSFYQFEFDDRGNPKTYTDTETYAFFKNFKVANQSEVFLKNRMANHPVMFMDLKFNVSQVKTIADVDALLNVKLREAFQEYFDVLPKLPKPTGSEFEVTKFEIEFMEKLQKSSASQFELTYGLYRLSNVLFKYFKRRVIILIDDYDYAAEQAVLTDDKLLDTDGAVYYFYSSINNMFRKTFKDNRKFKNYAMMTGISGRIEYADDEVTEHRFLDEHVFLEYFGFTETEVDELLTRYDFVFTQFDQVRKYYNGYLSRLGNHVLYSPYSIVQFVLAKAISEQEFKFQPYWAQTENQEFIKLALKSNHFNKTLREMVEDIGKRVNISSYHRAYPALDTFVRTINERRATFKGIHQLDESHLFHHLCEIGYLSHCITEGPDVYRIPNSEIKVALDKFFDNLTTELPKENL